MSRIAANSLADIEIKPDEQPATSNTLRKLQDKSFVEIVEAYRFYFWKVAADVMHPAIKSKVAPSDLVQESIITALNQFDRFEGETVMEFRNWIEGILHYKYMNLRRKHRIEQSPIPTRLPPASDRPGNHSYYEWVDLKSHDPLDNACHNEFAEQLRVKIGTLPEKLSDVMILKLEEDLSIASIARRLGIEESAAHKRYQRGLIQLGKKISNDPNFDE